MREFIAREPALMRGLVHAVLVALVAFGVSLTEVQAEAVMGVVGAGLAVATAWNIRGKVTPA